MTQKWNLQDIRPVEPRSNTRRMDSALNMQRPNTPMPARRPASERTEEMSHEETLPTIAITDGNRRNRGQIIAAITIFIIIVGAGIALSVFTAGAQVTLYPKVRDVNVNAEFTTYNVAKPDELSYEIMTLDATSERQVKATGQQQVSTQATGEIQISKMTPGTERLIKNTRFSDATGLVFRIQESVVVPGALKNSKGEMVPGTIQAQVFADQAGENYNLPANTKFDVPGFKEGGYTDLYDAIKATNMTPFAGGFNGPKFIIDDAELATAKQSLQLELRDTLIARIKNEAPAGFTSFDSSISFVYTDLQPVQYGDTLVTIREQATLQIPLFKDLDFASYIAKQTIAGYDSNEPVRIDNLNTLTFAYRQASTTLTNIANLDSLSFTISGAPRIVWTINEEQMKVDLLGREKTAFTSILAKYSGITKGEVKFRPFWSRSFPDKLNQIKITQVLSTP